MAVGSHGSNYIGAGADGNCGVIPRDVENLTEFAEFVVTIECIQRPINIRQCVHRQSEPHGPMQAAEEAKMKMHIAKPQAERMFQ